MGPGKVTILGISAYYHDSAACLIHGGKITAAAQEERFTREKHDPSFPSQAIRYCLDEAGIDISGIDYVGFYEKPFLKFERLLLTYLSSAPKGLVSFVKAMPVWLKEKVFMKDLLCKELNYHGKVVFAEHHESHAASAFFPSPFDRAAILTLDGAGEWTTAAYGTGRDNRIELRKDIHFPHSLGLLYSAFTYYAGFRVNSGEYKLMGLAPYGEPEYADIIRRELVDIKPDGSFRLNMKYFNYCAGLTMTNKRFHDLFGGPPRKPESPITQKHMDVARSIQEVTEEIVLKMANHVHALTGEENLCLAGGVALNCVANGRVLRETPFKNVWIQPAAGDAGGAMGVAQFIWYQLLKNPREIEPGGAGHNTFLGPDYENETRAFVEKTGYP